MAPSPTGSLHIGTARTALFNLLFARQTGGTLVLRMEDTDVERSTKESEQDILAGFSWLGITFDEGVMHSGTEQGEHGPYRQSECLDSYEMHLKKLLAEHKAYYCFCTKEELEAQRQNQEATGQVPKYVGTCRSFSDDEVQARLAAGKTAVIRIKVASGKKKFMDLIRGEVEFDVGLMGDLVIAKSLRQPLYNFAVVVDDAAMKISHVIRGEDHLANTPKQLLIAESLGFSSPEYAHLPLILSATGKGKMSKRDGGTTIKEYRDAGYLPEALINFLALLGWHPAPEPTGSVRGKSEQELFTLDELIKQFDLSRVQKAGAAFNKEKLDHVNSQYIRKKSDTELVELVHPFVPAAWTHDEQKLLAAVVVLKERLVTLSEFKELAQVFFELPAYDGKLLVWKKSTSQVAQENLELIKKVLTEIPDSQFTKEFLEKSVMPFAEAKGRGETLWPLRVALSGSEASPGPFELLTVLGKKESLVRIGLALKKLEPKELF